MVYIYNGILFSRKKRGPAFCTTWMDLEGITLNELFVRERQMHMLSLIGRISKRLTHGNKEELDGSQGQKGRGN